MYCLESHDLVHLASPDQPWHRYPFQAWYVSIRIVQYYLTCRDKKTLNESVLSSLSTITVPYFPFAQPLDDFFTFFTDWGFESIEESSLAIVGVGLWAGDRIVEASWVRGTSWAEIGTGGRSWMGEAFQDGVYGSVLALSEGSWGVVELGGVGGTCVWAICASRRQRRRVRRMATSLLACGFHWVISFILDIVSFFG